MKRKSSLDTADRLEKEGNNFHERVYNGYKEILNSEKNIEIIDATQSVEDVFSQCIEVLKGEMFYETSCCNCSRSRCL